VDDRRAVFDLLSGASVRLGALCALATFLSWDPRKGFHLAVICQCFAVMVAVVIRLFRPRPRALRRYPAGGLPCRTGAASSEDSDDGVHDRA
jgi:hypothetical protein